MCNIMGESSSPCHKGVNKLTSRGIYWQNIEEAHSYIPAKHTIIAQNDLYYVHPSREFSVSKSILLEKASSN